VEQPKWEFEDWNWRGWESKKNEGQDGKEVRGVEGDKRGTMKWGERMKMRWWEGDDGMMTRQGEFNLGRGQAS